MNDSTYDQIYPQCIQCSVTFRAYRRDTRYCSAACRKAAQRTRDKRNSAIHFWIHSCNRVDSDTFLHVVDESPGSLEMFLDITNKLFKSELDSLMSTFRIISKLPSDFSLAPDERLSIINDFQLFYKTI